jgi:hypothetical protein
MNDEVKESNQLEDKLQVYENNDAYILGENTSGNDSLKVGYQPSMKNSEKKLNMQKELLNKFDTNLSEDNNEEKEHNDSLNNSKELNQKTTENIIDGSNNSLNNQKYLINNIDSDIENNPKDNQIDLDYNNNNNNNYENQNEENDESNDIPLVTLNFLSICQCCKNPFNSTNNIPYLFKCGHFFCKQCIIEQFTDEEGIKCPTDGFVSKSISNLKILNNFITDKTSTQRTSIPIPHMDNKQKEISSNTKKMKTCEIHKGQRLTHFIEETREIICIYCAFDRYKQNPGIQIKEISDKCNEMNFVINSVIEENQYNVSIIQSSLKEIKKNKESEEKKINEIFDRIFEMVKIKKDEFLSKIDHLFTNNAEKLSQKLELFSYKIEKSEKMKQKINKFLKKEEKEQFLQLYEYYHKLMVELQKFHSLRLNLQKYKFFYEDDITIMKMISKFGDIKLSPKIFNFVGNIKQEKQDIINDSNYDNIKSNKQSKTNINNYVSESNLYNNYNNNHRNNILNKKDINIKNNSTMNFYNIHDDNNTYHLNDFTPKKHIHNYTSNQLIYNNTDTYNKSKYMINRDKYNMFNKNNCSTNLNNSEYLYKGRNPSLNERIIFHNPTAISKEYQRCRNIRLLKRNNNLYDANLSKKINKYKINLNNPNRNYSINNNSQYKFNSNINKSYSFCRKC